MMKMLIVTLVVALLMSAGSALKCYKCGQDGKCTIETCQTGQDTCIASKVSTSSGSFDGKKCVTRAQCVQYQKTSKWPAACCGTDLCNNAVP